MIIFFEILALVVGQFGIILKLTPTVLNYTVVLSHQCAVYGALSHTEKVKKFMSAK